MAQENIVVPHIIEMPTHEGAVMPHISAHSMQVGSFEWKPGKYCVSVSMFNNERNHGYVSMNQPEEIDMLVQLLLDAKMNCGRLERGESFIPSASPGKRQ